jgi:hypothetical protein
MHLLNARCWNTKTEAKPIPVLELTVLLSGERRMCKEALRVSWKAAGENLQSMFVVLAEWLKW